MGALWAVDDEYFGARSYLCHNVRVVIGWNKRFLADILVDSCDYGEVT